jgi:hypothetical protein
MPTSGPIVRTGATPEFWKNYDNIFGGKKAASGKKAAGKQAAGKQVTGKAAAKKATAKATARKKARPAGKK